MKLRLLKDLANRVLVPMGYQLVSLARQQTIPADLRDAEYYRAPDRLQRLFHPWELPQFDRWFRPAVMEHTMLGRQKLYFLLRLFRATLHVPGDVFEAGSGSGGSCRLMLDALDEANCRKRVWSLDTFEGYLKVDPQKDGSHRKLNDCRRDGVEEVKALLESDTQEVHVIKGLIPGTLEQVAAEQISFAHIDVNLHEPTFASTCFALERLMPGGVILFDDYGWPANYGARVAIDEACAKHGVEPIAIPGEQAFLFKART